VEVIRQARIMPNLIGPVEHVNALSVINISASCFCLPLVGRRLQKCPSLADLSLHHVFSCFFCLPQISSANAYLALTEEFSTMRSKLTPALVQSPSAIPAVKEEMDRAKERGRDRIFVWDTALEGFGLMLMATGSQSYVVQYRHNGKSLRTSLSAILDLTAARKKAKAILGEAAQGHDPIGQERRAREAVKNTLQSIHDEYFAARESNLKASSVRSENGSG
jgi:hypothetical protein